MKNRAKIWIVDDERIIRVTLSDDLRDAGYEVMEFAEATAVLAALQQTVPDIIITDLKIPGMDGIELLQKVKTIAPSVSIVMMTAHGTTENAVKAMKLGAYDYLLKPFQTDEVLLLISRILEINDMKTENRILRKQIQSIYDYSAFIGDEHENKELFNHIGLIAEKDTTVLLTGETGTGKELITNIIHFNSHRKKQALVKVSCAILSREIFESELFGHVKGAFTGADSDKQGRFEMADRGTLYLDDIDDIPLDLQVKLLRAIEQREIEKVGSSKSIPIDVRIIASTKKNLRNMVAEGKFREDLFYRLNIFPIQLKPLRERKNDIPILLSYFIERFTDGQQAGITADAMKLLQQYHWPGNVRELKNIAERLAIFSNGAPIDTKHIPMEIRPSDSIDFCASVGRKPLEQLLSELEIKAIQCALDQCGNNKSKAAEMLGLPLSTLRSKIEKYGI
jgi:DNA-binding NtrC family response regulator